MNTVRRVSASSFSVLDCGRRYAFEFAIGQELALKMGLEWTDDRRARERGIIFHQIAETVAKGMMHGVQFSKEDIRALVMAVPGLDCEVAGEMETGVSWWAERMAGTTPVAVEDDGGRWSMTRNGIEITGKFDVKHYGEEGLPVVTDFKSGFVPDKEEAKKTTQNRLYAWVTAETDNAAKVGVSMVSLGNRFSFMLEYTRQDIEEYRPYLERDIAKVHECMVAVAEATTDKLKTALLDDERFAPRLHAWCPGCPVKRSCAAYIKTVWVPRACIEDVTGVPAAMERLRLVKKFVDHEEKAIGKQLKAQAMECGPEGFVEDGYRVKVVTRVDEYAAKPATQRTVNTLIVEKEETA